LANFNTNFNILISTLHHLQYLQVTVLPFLLEICRLFGAFFLSPKDLPGYFVWLDALSVRAPLFLAITIIVRLRY
jgi:ATP-binding cassette, subfamily G (WHITE), member 2